MAMKDISEDSERRGTGNVTTLGMVCCSEVKGCKSSLAHASNDYLGCPGSLYANDFMIITQQDYSNNQ
jgi:hypothetical protein